MAVVPSSTAVSPESFPPKLPSGVRTADTMYTSLNMFIWVFSDKIFRFWVYQSGIPRLGR